MAYDANGDWIPDEDTTTTEEALDLGATSTEDTATVESAIAGFNDGTTQDAYNAAAAEAEAKAVSTLDYSGYEAPSQETVDSLKSSSASSYITPETTVAGQLASLLDTNSALERESTRTARNQASALGMLSSDSAVTAQRRANLDAYLDIAKQDAASALALTQQQQKTDDTMKTIMLESEVSGALNVQKAQIAEQQVRVNQAWDATIKGLDAATAERATAFKADIDVQLKNLEGAISRELQQQEIDANVEQTIMNKAYEAMNNYQVSVQTLLASGDFLDNMAGDQDTMYKVFNDMFATVSSTLVYSAQAAGVYTDADGTGGLKDYITQMVDANLWGTV